MTEIALIIFLIPAVELIFSFFSRIVFAEKRTIKFLEGTKKYGFKMYILRKPLTYLSFLAYLLSPIFITYGWLWFAYGVLLLIPFSIILIRPAPNYNLCSVGSNEFNNLIARRRKEGILTVPILLLWCFSWV